MNTSHAIYHKGSFLYKYPCQDPSDCFPIIVNLTEGPWQIECWGASGGGSYSEYKNYYFVPGKGGYSTGIINVVGSQILYLYIGGEGLSNITRTQYNGIAPGGYNGGGHGYVDKYKAASGGGATDVRIGNDSVENRIIVAGAGGGAGSTNDLGSTLGSFGGHGGGLEGKNGGGYNNIFDKNSGRGGTQTKGGDSATSTALPSEEGQLWKGGNAGTGTESSSGGGGGGYYGGSGGAGAGGGGGSGYVSPHLKSAKTIAGSEIFPSPYEGIENGHIGNGFIRITYINLKFMVSCRYIKSKNFNVFNHYFL